MLTSGSKLLKLLLLLLLSLILFACKPGKILELHGKSMEPNFVDGQKVMVDPVEVTDLKRGDVIFYEYKDTGGRIKRIVALPGETIEIRDGKIMIDGQDLEEPYEVNTPGYEVSPLKLLENEFYVLGDNRDESADSHVLGPVPADAILGRVRQ